MANLYDILSNAEHGEALADIGREYGLTPQQTEAAVASLLPAISAGLKRATATPEGLGDLFALMGARPDLYAIYDDPEAAFSPRGRDAGNAVLAKMFGSPEASRAVADQAQQFSGVSSGILKKLLPIIAGLIISGLMRSGSGKAQPQAPAPTPEPSGGGLFDILRQIFQQGGPAPSSSSSGPSPVPPLSDILGAPRDGSPTPSPAPQEAPVPRSEPAPAPAEPGTPAPGGDLLTQILRELEKGIKDGRIKPVIVGPYEVNIPEQAGPAEPGQPQGTPQSPGGDIFGQILRDLLGGAGGKAQAPGAAVFGDLFEAGPKVEKTQIDSFQEVLDRFLGPQR